MTLNRRIRLCLFLPREFMRQVAAGLGLMMLVLQTALPTNAAIGGMWIEICGEHGAEMVQLDLSGEVIDPTEACCVTCADCMTCAGFAAIDAPLGTTAEFVWQMHSATLIPFAVFAPSNPAQFWPDNRGPPVLKSEISDAARPVSLASTLNGRPS